MLELSSHAQIFEAENAALSGGASKLSNASASGAYVVNLGEGNLTFSINLTETSFFNINIYAAAPYGEKTNFIIKE